MNTRIIQQSVCREMTVVRLSKADKSQITTHYINTIPDNEALQHVVQLTNEV
jgi:hypothetical protein